MPRSSMNCLSLDHRLAPLSLRKQYALTTRAREAAIFAMRPLGGVVPLVTCNRTEFYFTCSFAQARRVLGAVAGELSPFTQYAGEGAQAHLFLLAAGLSSMLIGEDEILGQLRDAYEFARGLGATADMDGAFQAALACGKRVRAETKISSFACSVATLASAAVKQFGGRRALVIGATGKLGASVVRNLRAEGVLVSATMRRHAPSAAEDALEEGVVRVPYSERYAALAGQDAIICCTAASHAVLRLEEVARATQDGHPRLFLDLAVPPDLEEGIAQLPCCTVMNIDAFERAAEENNRKKQRARGEAEELVRTCLAQFRAGELARRNPALMQDGALRALRKCDPVRFLQACAPLEERE